jgi:lysophospholipase L1-like esterase
MAAAHYHAVMKHHFGAARLSLNDGAVRAVILGDSVARGAGDESGQGIAGSLTRLLDERFADRVVVENLGIDGARTANVRHLVSSGSVRSSIEAADIVVVSIGGNDLYGDARARFVATFFPSRQQTLTIRRIGQVVARIRASNPAAHIYLLGLYNPYGNSPLSAWLDRQINLWDSRLIERFAGARDLTVVRIADLLRSPQRLSPIDHFHPGAAGYVAIAHRITAGM